MKLHLDQDMPSVMRNLKHWICFFFCFSVKEEPKRAQTSLHYGFQKAPGKKAAWKSSNPLTWLQKRKQSFIILDLYKEWHQNISLEWLEISKDVQDEL